MKMSARGKKIQPQRPVREVDDSDSEANEEDLEAFRATFHQKDVASDSDPSSEEEGEALSDNARFEEKEKRTGLKRQLSSLRKVNEDSSSESEDSEETAASGRSAATQRQRVEEATEDEKRTVREELSKMSMEEMLKVKEKIGLKLYNKALGLERKAGGVKNSVKFKRENKNRPREVSSKKTVARYRDVVGLKSEQKLKKRDPRFDNLCGDFDEKMFKDSYKFVEGIKDKELKTLKEQLEDEQDPEEIQKIKYLVQRMENQQREKLKVEKRKELDREQRRKNKELAKEGKKPEYMGKRERRTVELVDKYEELKKSGKLETYMKKKSKKMLARDRKRVKGSIVL